MKQSAILPAMLAGEKLMIGEFRDWAAEEKPSKKHPGTCYTFEKFYIVVGRDSIEVTTFHRDGKRLADMKRPAWKSGDRVVVNFTGFSRTDFGLRSEGKVEALEA